jgi:hypothetical protein
LLEDELLPVVERELELLGCDELETRGEELQRLVVWRALQFGELGFDRRTAIALADSDVDVGDARRVVANGCPLQLACRILL